MAETQTPHGFESEQDAKIDSSNCDNIILLYMYEWAIINYSLIKYFPSEVESPDIIVGKNNECVMKLRLSREKDKCIKIAIVLQKNGDLEENEINKRINYKKSELNLEFLDSKGKVLDYYRGLPCEFGDDDIHCYWKRDENVSRFIENDMLKIRAKLSLRYPIISLENKRPRSESIDQLSDDMIKLIGGGVLPDLLIKVGGKSFLAHKSILQPQLSCIKFINSELKDEKLKLSSIKYCYKNVDSSNKVYETVSIPNENAEVFLSILYYLYGGKICSSDINDFDLYQFAQKYQLYELCTHLKPVEIHSRSQANSTKVAFYWHVKEYSIRSIDKFNLLQSPIYKTRVGTNEISWSACLFCFDSQSIFLSLRRLDCLEKAVQTIFKLIVCNPDFTPHEERQFKHFFTSQYANTYPGFLDPESRFTVNPNLLFDDTLSIRCEITVSDGQLTSEIFPIYPSDFSKADLKSWIKNLHNLLETGKFSDVTLLVDEEEFKVHKTILSARSPVFERMFETNMAEKLSGSVRIEDISCAVMKCALTYIYTGKFDVLTMNVAPELYRTADKYEMLHLKERCAEFIMNNIDVDSACEVLILSDLYNDDNMKKLAENLICQNATASILTSFGQEIMMNFPHLASNILDKLSIAYCSLPPQDTYDSKNKE